MPVIATSASSRTEPTMPWNAAVQGFDALAVRQQLGATRTQLSTEARGILDLDPTLINAQLKREASTGDWNRLIWAAMPDDNITAGIANGLATLVPIVIYPGDSTVSFCPACLASPPSQFSIGGPNAKQTAVFLETLQETGDPSRALQAHLTVLISMAYMEILPTFTYNDTVFISFFETPLVPTAHTGFWIVIVTLCTHLVSILLITVYFSIRTQYSLLDNAWQVLAQAVTVETEDILQETTLATDTNVKEWLKKAGRVDDRVNLQLSSGSNQDDLSFSVHLLNVGRESKHPTSTEGCLKRD
jgi:hypothetical protein